MASFVNEDPLSGAPDSAALSDTLREILEQPDEYFQDPNYFHNPPSLENYDEFDWTNLPKANNGTDDSYVDGQHNIDPLILQPQAVYPQLTPPVISLTEENIAPAIRTSKAPNKRSENIGKVNPANFYQPLPFVPMSWPSNEKTFQYNNFGELLPHLNFSPAQIMEFITEHPGNLAIDGSYNGKTSSLTLWLQTAPADSARRYPTPASDKCRFNCCPVVNNSIQKGTFRVAFDEWNFSGMSLDPYHCAGYVHLYCLEKFTPFSSICANFNVRPDDRVFPEGRNKMAITRDHEIFSRFIDKYIRIVSKPDFDHLREYDYKKTLCHKLVKTHLELEPQVRQKVREERGGNSIDKHMGDLTVFAEGEVAKKAARDALKPPKIAKAATRNSKRKRDEESPDMDDIFRSPSPSAKRTRT